MKFVDNYETGEHDKNKQIIMNMQMQTILTIMNLMNVVNKKSDTYENNKVDDHVENDDNYEMMKLI